MAENIIPVYIRVDLNVEVEDIECLTKEEWDKQKDKSSLKRIFFKLKNERKIREHALDLLYRLGYSVRLVR